MRPFRQNTNPLRVVVEAVRKSGQGGLLSNHHFGIRWWELKLECGHEVERSVTYEPGASEGRQGFAVLRHPAPLDKMLPAPKRARCEYCGREAQESSAGSTSDKREASGDKR